jgi:hypothetical protein
MDANASNLTLACSLSAAEYAERLRAFRRLFAVSLQAVRREPTRLQLLLDADTAGDAEVRDLLRREQECCPFFSFTVERTAGSIAVETVVPLGAEECLNDLERLAHRAARP